MYETSSILLKPTERAVKMKINTLYYHLGLKNTGKNTDCVKIFVLVALPAVRFAAKEISVLNMLRQLILTYLLMHK